MGLKIRKGGSKTGGKGAKGFIHTRPQPQP